MPQIVLNLLGIIVFSFFLVKSVTFLISSATKLAIYLKISEYTVSLFVVSVATSLPELIVGIASALENDPLLSYGNVVGSNIADLTIVVAIPVFVGGAISTKRLIRHKDIITAGVMSIFPILLLLDGAISRLDGMLLLCAYFLYVGSVLRRDREFEGFHLNFERVSVAKEILILLVSSVVLWLSARGVVLFAENLSVQAGMSVLLVGLLITSIGTSLPELVFGLKAVQMHHNDEVLGNLVGSVIANSTLILGATAFVKPIVFPTNYSLFPYIYMIAVILLFFVFARSKEILSRLEANVLFLLYFTFVLVSLIF